MTENETLLQVVQAVPEWSNVVSSSWGWHVFWFNLGHQPYSDRHKRLGPIYVHNNDKGLYFSTFTLILPGCLQENSCPQTTIQVVGSY